MVETLAEAVMEQQNNKQKSSLSGIPAVFQQVVFSLLQHHANMFVVLFPRIFLQQILYCMNLVHISQKKLKIQPQ